MPQYKLVDLIVEMNPKYNPLRQQSIPYLVDKERKESDYIIPDITKEVKEYNNQNPHLSIGECEYILYGSYFYTMLIDYDALLLHASAVSYQGEGYLFSGPSGVGKSTHTQYWLEAFEEAFILNDDKPAIRLIDKQLFVYGTPFSGKTNLNKNVKLPIKGICFIEQANTNWIYKVGSKEAIGLLLSETVRSKSNNRMDKTLNMIETIIKEVPIYKMGVKNDISAAYMAYREMKEEI